MPVVPTWFRVHGGFALQSGIDRRTAVELWYADDIELTVANEAPNDTTLFQSLPPIGSPSSDPGLTGAIVIDHRIIEPAVKIGTAARAKVAVIYDSEVRFRLDPRQVTSFDQENPVEFAAPLIHSFEPIPGGGNRIITRRDEKVYDRARWRRRVAIRLASDDPDALVDLISEQMGLGFVFGSIPYIFDQFSISQLGSGEVNVTYGFWTLARVKALPANTYGTHVAVPALLHLEKYKVDEPNGTVGKRTAAELYDPRTAPLPGGIG